MDDTDNRPKPLYFVVEAIRDDLRSMPVAVRKEFGHALYMAQCGEKHGDAEPLKEYRGADVLEVRKRYRGDTYRAVYTTRFEGAIYVSHVFQK